MSLITAFSPPTQSTRVTAAPLAPTAPHFGMAFTPKQIELADQVLEKLWPHSLTPAHFVVAQADETLSEKFLKGDVVGLLGYAGRIDKIQPTRDNITFNVEEALRIASKERQDQALAFLSLHDDGSTAAFIMKRDWYRHFTPHNLELVAHTMGLDITG